MFKLHGENEKNAKILRRYFHYRKNVLREVNGIYTIIL